LNKDPERLKISNLLQASMVRGRFDPCRRLCSSKFPIRAILTGHTIDYHKQLRIRHTARDKANRFAYFLFKLCILWGLWTQLWGAAVGTTARL